MPTTSLSLELLHQHAQGLHVYDRRSGRTTAMLVEALQQADFDVERVAVVGQTMKQAQVLMDYAWLLAEAMGFEVRPYKRFEFRIQGTHYEFLSAGQASRGSLRSWKRTCEALFWDHFAKGIF